MCSGHAMLRTDVKTLQDIPNVGKAIEKKLFLLGLNEPIQLIGRDPYEMYSDLCNITGKRHDPCVLDVFISAVRFMEGGAPEKWWVFTEERKKQMGTN